MTEVTQKVNKSFKFILPMLGGTFADYGDVLSVFVGDKDKKEYNDHIFVLYAYDGSKYFAGFEARLREHPLFETYYDPSKEHVMFVFKVPKMYSHEYEQFKTAQPGCFGNFSLNYKNHILKFFQGAFDLTIIKKILWKHESLYKELENELGVKIPRTVDNTSIPDMDVEMYSKTKII